MRPLRNVFFLIASVPLVSACGGAEGEQSKPNPCDPVGNIYEGSQHYIGRDYVREDGTLDYGRWFESRRVASSPCDPVSGRNARIGGTEIRATPPAPKSAPAQVPPLLESPAGTRTQSPSAPAGKKPLPR